MSNAIVSNVYRYVIDDVINQVRGDFEDMGIDDSILQELQRSWESKVARSRVANFGFKDDGYYDEEGESSNNNNTTSGTAPNATTAPHATNATASNNNNTNNNNEAPTLQYPSEYAQQPNQPAAASLANLATAAGRSQQQQQHGYGLPPPPRMIPDPSTLVNQYQMMQSPLNNNNNDNNKNHNNLPELQLPGLPRPNLPQNDGANDDELTTQEIDQRIEDMIQSSQLEEEQEHGISFTASSFSGEPLALDSLPDSVKQLMKEARERAIKAGAMKSKTRIPQLDGEGDEEVADDDDINSDLDDSDDDDDDGEGGEEIEHIILCLYDKVTRTKNKWKCILKDGIMLVNGRDYLFHRANGDFEW